VFGWIIPRWRFSNLIVLSLLFLGIFGIWYGYGYCLFTDWHWRIRELLGYPNDSNSYLFSDSKTNRVFPEKWIDLTTAIVFFYILFH
jgi:hypothetical protein